jgi:hypothetical protein
MTTAPEIAVALRGSVLSGPAVEDDVGVLGDGSWQPEPSPALKVPRHRPADIDDKVPPLVQRYR